MGKMYFISFIFRIHKIASLSFSLQQYASCSVGVSDLHKDILGELSDLEQKLLEQEIMSVKGKVKQNTNGCLLQIPLPCI